MSHAVRGHPGQTGHSGGKRRRRRQGVRWLDSITNSMDTNLSKTPGESGRQRSPACCSLWGHRVGHNLVTEQQQQRVFPAIRCEHKNWCALYEGQCSVWSALVCKGMPGGECVALVVWDPGETSLIAGCRSTWLRLMDIYSTKKLLNTSISLVRNTPQGCALKSSPRLGENVHYDLDCHGKTWKQPALIYQRTDQ